MVAKCKKIGPEFKPDTLNTAAVYSVNTIEE